MNRSIKPIRVEGNIAYVPLTQGYEAIIDAEDISLVQGWNWCARVCPRSVYARRTDYSGEKQCTVFLHRAIMKEPEGLEVDHRDGNGLNNTRANLRVATRYQNQHNARLSRSNTSGLKGAHFHRKRNKWCAQIAINNRQITIGYFATLEAAHAAYAEASAEFHREFGRTG